MDAAAMTRLLSSANGDDPAALQRELRAALGEEEEALGEEELGERVREAVACLRSPASRLAFVSRQLLAATADATAGPVVGERLTPGEWLVLDELSTYASDALVALAGGKAAEEVVDEEPEADEGVLWDVLAAFAARSAEELGRGSREKRWTQWCERALRAVHSVHEEDGRNGEDAVVESDEKRRRRRRTRRQAEATRAVARALLSLHNTLAESGTGRPVDLKLATLVWKNLTKLAKSHADMLFGGEPIVEANGVKEATEQAAAPLNAEDVVNCVVSAMESVVGQLIASLESAAQADSVLVSGSGGKSRDSVAAVGSALKVLRLYWRAFQGHFLHLASALSSSTLENCVLTTVNTASALMYTTAILPSSQRVHGARLSPKLVRDADSVLELVMSFPAKMTSVHDATSPLLPETGLAIVQALLWYPADDMVRAIAQRQEESRSEEQRGDPSATTARDEGPLDVATRWAHWCLLVAIAAASRPDTHHEDGADIQLSVHNGSGAVELLDKLLDRYRDDCAIKSSAAILSSTRPLAIDALLELLPQLAEFEQLQLAMLKHSVHPCVDQRHLCWELWKELICYCWEEDTALAALQSLFTLVEQVPDEDKDASHSIGHDSQTPTPLSSPVVDEITRLVAFMYSDMPLALKAACVQRVTAVVEHVCGDGPFHVCSPSIAAGIALLDQLSAARFLREYDHPDKEQWIATQLPMCFECCGTIIELLGGSNAAPDLREDADKFAGAMRVLDVCLLVLKSVYDDNDTREDTTDLVELSRILLPVMTEVLALLAKTSQQPPPVVSASATTRTLQRAGPTRTLTSASSTSSIARVLRTCLYLLRKMGARVKRNHSNQCVQVMKNLLDLTPSSGPVDRNWEQSASGPIAWFVKTTLFDVQAAEGDVPVVAELLTALLQRLCTTEQAAMKSPLGSVLVQALYGVLAHSNVARSLHIPASMPLVGARRDVRQLALLHKQVDEDFHRLASSVAALVSSSGVLAARARHSTRSHRVFRQRFHPSPDRSKEGPQSGDNVSSDDQSSSIAALSRKHQLGKENGASSTATARVHKRQKLGHLVARCRQVIDNCGSTADSVSDQELDRAAKVLEDILAKVLSY